MSRNEFTCDCTSIHQHAVDEVLSKMLKKEAFSNLSELFKLIGDGTRIRILWALDVEERLCVCDIANILNMTKSAVSHQLGTLRKANLVTCSKEGKKAYYSLADDHVKQLIEVGLEHINE